MSRNHPCDACGAPRLRWQRLCNACFGRLPGDVRNGLLDAFRARNMPAWRRLRRRARDLVKAPVRAAVPPTRAYALAAAITGERD